MCYAKQLTENEDYFVIIYFHWSCLYILETVHLHKNVVGNFNMNILILKFERKGTNGGFS